MNINEIINRLWIDEGAVPYAYQDTKGFWTVGPGILIDKRRGGLLREEMEYLLKNRTLDKVREVNARFPWFSSLDASRQQVIVCMSYQLGVNGVANFKRMCQAMLTRDYERAADEMLDSNWAREDTPARAGRMSVIMRTGLWV